GLGLAISSQLVAMMGGHIHIESTVGVGSTLWFSIRLEKREAHAREVPCAAPMGALAGVRALIVESSAISRGILHSQISSWGMTNRITETPEHALELLTQAASRGVPYDVAIIDLGLPGGMATLELGRMIKADPAIAGVRLIMLTPVGRHADISEARKIGIDACLVKPVRQTALYECLVTLLSGSSAPAGVAIPVEMPAGAAPSGRGNLLLAEDNLINQAVALGVLNLEGYTVKVVANGKEALDAHAEGSFDLLLMDCHMPVMDGYEATRIIREREQQSGAKRVPIIALTANAMIQDREECLRA